MSYLQNEENSQRLKRLGGRRPKASSPERSGPRQNKTKGRKPYRLKKKIALMKKRVGKEKKIKLAN